MRKFFAAMDSINRIMVESPVLENNMLSDPSRCIVDIYVPAGHDDKGCRCSLSGALRQGLKERDRPTVIDVVVTRDPTQMLPAVDNRTVEIKRGDRVA